ncbi:hypothetical protein JCM19237_298 [Photobacterium aphoticum]|uniref:Uncharacterized protein n=1 Tax=Photobacterium aphoticum TaxID=754436 RepID=A0A090R069_9GAMM|nr:hypothetical protein JCM19237_298 [Photobacterium aphoticum]
MIPKAQLLLVVSLMEAMPLDGTHYKYHHAITYCPNDECYYGYFDQATLNRLQAVGVITILGQHDDDMQCIKLIERDDFLASFAAGVSEARNGSDLHYADYNSNQYAFTAGYQHYQNRNKKKRATAYSLDGENVCHGFVLEDTGEVWKQ